METGVYIIQNTINKKIYIGGAYTSFKRRFWQHKRKLTTGCHFNQFLQNAWNKHGPSAFTFSIKELCDVDEVEAREQFWIDKLQATNRKIGYNISPTAGSRKGVKELGTRAKRILAGIASGIAKRKNGLSEEYRAAMRAAQRRRFADPEQRRRLTQLNIGRKRSVETRMKMSEGQKRVWASCKNKAARMKNAQLAARSPEVREKALATWKKRRQEASL